MSRYVIAHRLSSGVERLQPLKIVTAALAGPAGFAPTHDESAGAAESEDPAHTTLVETDASEIERRRQTLADDVIVEEEAPRWPALFRPGANLPIASAPDVPAGVGGAIDVALNGANVPIDSALVQLSLASPRFPMTTSVARRTDGEGAAALPYDPRNWVPVSLTIVPKSGSWPIVLPVRDRRVPVTLTPLPRTGPLGWWHLAVGATAPETAGEGIRVGVIDTGVGPHPYLNHVKRAGAIINGDRLTGPDDTNDVADHGTHVSGTIGARPDPRSGDFRGIAPAAELVAVRVYPGGGPPGFESGGATNNDISLAMTMLSRDEQCDIINISSAGMSRSELEADRLTAAVNRGTIVICAAGNGGGPPVLFPGAAADAVAVSALGFLGCEPAPLEMLVRPQQFDRYAFGYYSPSFSSFGPEVRCAAPGVGVIATVPTDAGATPAYAAMSGTSMSAPVISGVLAALLSRDSRYRSLGRTKERSAYAWTVLARCLRTLGLAPWYQGLGIARQDG